MDLRELARKQLEAKIIKLEQWLEARRNKSDLRKFNALAKSWMKEVEWQVRNPVQGPFQDGQIISTICCAKDVYKLVNAITKAHEEEEQV